VLHNQKDTSNFRYYLYFFCIFVC